MEKTFNINFEFTYDIDEYVEYYAYLKKENCDGNPANYFMNLMKDQLEEKYEPLAEKLASQVETIYNHKLMTLEIEPI